MRRSDITAERDTLVLRAGEEGWVRVTTESGVDPTAVYWNWVEVLGFLDRYPSTQLLAGRLDKGAELAAFAANARRDERPLLTPIDRWGHTPFAPTPLTGHSVAGLVRAHLTGQAPVHKRPPARTPTLLHENAVAPVAVDVDLDQDYYDRGIVARRNAHTRLETVTDILDGIDDEADKLLADLLAILDRTEID
ncbi:hypothetical protein [Rhodococcus sp. ACPA1]|uniref:hypothetical protein n=1 Tax=Rhodococcus sp. ACPA1 TaxID=2028572 RepID=UPI00211C1E22|nr:hypothetical protein [Rhodococcus sp. ACPA1]